MSKNNKQVSTDAARPPVVDDSPHEAVTTGAPGRAADVTVERQRLDGLGQLRAEREKRLAEICAERELLAHAVEVLHDQKAIKDSAALDDEEARLTKRIMSLKAAEVEQGRRVMAAEAAEKSAGDRARGAALAEKALQFRALAQKADVANAETVAAANAMAVLAVELGIPWQEFEVYGHLAENTAAMQLVAPRGSARPEPWMVGVAARPLRYLAPNEQRDWRRNADIWLPRVRTKITALLGEQAEQTSTTEAA
jgi:hypothetical protein